MHCSSTLLQVVHNVVAVEAAFRRLGDSVTRASREKTAHVRQLSSKIQDLKRRLFRARRVNDQLNISLEKEKEMTREVVLERDEWRKLAQHLQAKYEGAGANDEEDQSSEDLLSEGPVHVNVEEVSPNSTK